MKQTITTRELERFINERITDILDVLKTKGKVYTGDKNRFKNFNEASDILQCEPEEALVGFMTKHIVWLFDFVRQLKSQQTVTKEEISEVNEKIGDTINYLLILNAMLFKRYNDKRLQQLTEHISKINNEDEQDEIRRIEEKTMKELKETILQEIEERNKMED